MYKAIRNGLVTVWNLAPAAVKVANDVLHTVYEPTHAFVHRVADLLAITLR